MAERIMRNLDGVYFRVKTDDGYKSICWSDLTEEEMRKVLKDKKKDYITELAILIGRTLRVMGDKIGIEAQYEGDTADDNVFE